MPAIERKHVQLTRNFQIGIYSVDTVVSEQARAVAVGNVGLG